MAINYADKYAEAALEAFAGTSYTDIFAGQFDWTGAKSVKVFTNDTVALSDYSRTGGYGTPTTVGNTVDTLTLTQDKGFSANLDKLDMASTAGAMAAGQWLGMETRQILAPAVDKYRFGALYSACPSGQIVSGAVTSANAYTKWLAGTEVLQEAYVSLAGCAGFATPSFLNKIKQDSMFVKASDLAQDQIAFRGQVGAIDGVPVIGVPNATINATDNNIEFLIVSLAAVAAPIKLADYMVYEDVPGWSGSRVEGRIVHDCFLLDTLNDGIYIHTHA